VGSIPTTRANFIFKPMAKVKIIEYAKESYDELLHKVSWPSWSELQSSAIVVSVASLIIALVVYLMDIGFNNVLKGFYTWF
jgi:preprotein translocase subunit SecE